MEDERILEELKGKIIGVGLFMEGKNRIEINMFRLLDLDNLVLKLQAWNGQIFYLPYSTCYRIDQCKESEEKFLRYERKYKEDPDFEPDEEDESDKGYRFIKKLVKRK